MRVIGLTGGSLTGKSLVVDILKNDLQVPVLNTESLSRDISNINSPALAQIAVEFGEEVLNQDGTMNKEFVRELIEGDEATAQKIIKIVVSSVQDWTLKELQRLERSGEEIVVVESSNLIERGRGRYDEIILVTCAPELQRQRLIEVYGEDDAQRIIDTEIPLSIKEQSVDYIITNNGSLEDLISEVNRVWKEIKSES